MQPLLETAKRIAQPVVLPFLLPISFDGFFRQQLPIAEAYRLLERELATREKRFLDVVRTEVFEQPGTPYDRLFRIAGYELGDLRSLVSPNGLEHTLGQLRSWPG